MEPKRELTSVDIAALVGELRDIVGAKVDKVYLYGDDLVRFRLRHYEFGRLELVLEVGETKRVHLVDPTRIPDAPERPPNFARMLRNKIAGGELTSVEQYEFDRILVFTFERGDETITVIGELFGNGNVIVADSSNTIVDALDTVRLRSRTVAPGATYEFPQSQLDPFSVDAETVRGAIGDSDSDIVRTLATQLNLGGTYAEEVCERAGIDKHQEADSISTDNIDRIAETLGDIGQRITDRRIEPSIYLSDGEPVDVTPFPLAEYADLDVEPFDRFTTALDAYFHRREQVTTTDSPDEPDQLRSEIETKQRIIAQQESAIEDFEAEAAAVRSQAETVYAHYETVAEVIDAVQAGRDAGHSWDEIQSRLEAAADAGSSVAQAIEAFDPSTGTVTVDLDGTSVPVDTSMGVERNADRLYTEAKEIVSKREGAEAAIEETKADLARLEAKAESGPVEETDQEEDESGPTDWVSNPSIPVRTSDHWYEQFRWMHTSDDFLVIGGRNADQNEALVSKYLEPHDRFFHATAHGGPVTILKAAGPSEPSEPVEFPDRTLGEAAQFAVSYSSVWKAEQFVGEAYMVTPEQVSKQPESGEYLSKGEFVIRGDRTYFDSVPVGLAVGISCEPRTEVLGGPPDPIQSQTEVSYTVEPGNVAQEDVAKRLYRRFRETFADTSFVRKIASPDLIQEFLPPGRSVIVSE